MCKLPSSIYNIIYKLASSNPEKAAVIKNKTLSLLFQSYSSHGRGGSGGGAGDEDYEIPPITPPNHADPSLLHLMEHESGYPFHSLPHNSLLNGYSYPELPALMMSNMLGQDTHLLSGPMHSVSPPFIVPFVIVPVAGRGGAVGLRGHITLIL